MPKFKFSLEKILELKKQKLEQAQIELSKAQKAYQEEVAREQKIREAILLSKKQLFASGQIQGKEIFLTQQHLKGLEAELKICLQRQHILSQEITLWRQEVLKRNKEKKVLENLKQKQWEKFIHEQKQKEQKELDEVATLSFQHKVENSF
ncbi:MAG: Flagellar export protein FliJ [Desulfonauticus sp. 38_4375]|nr:MAG: Flagellar export protein FliJ [Desulfonauticus sp. 38_4375]